MKILLLANHFNTGGISTYLLTLTKGYLDRGHQVILATSGGDCAAEAQAMGARHMLVPALRVKCEFHPGLFRAAATLARLVREEAVDILHAQTRVTMAVAALAGAWTGRPYISTCHGFFKQRLSRMFFPLWGRAAIAISRSVALHLTGDMRVGQGKVFFVPNGVDTQKFKPAPDEQRRVLRARFGLGEQPVIGIIARLSDVKGHAYLIEAVHELVHRMPGVKCLIFGDGPLECELKDQVQRLKLGTAVLFFRMNGSPAELLPMFDVFVMPSLQEGLGLSVMEAEACGIPVVASRVGGLVEAVKDGATGLLVQSRDHLALADALGRVLSDKDLARRFSCHGPVWVREMFSVEKMVKGTLDVYQRVLGNK